MKMNVALAVFNEFKDYVERFVKGKHKKRDKDLLKATLAVLDTDIFIKEQATGWIPIKDKLPENAEHPGAFCEKVYVLTVWGETIGWYNPDVKAWFFLEWYSDHGKMVIDFEHGDIPEVAYIPRDTKLITHWKPMIR